MILEGQVADGGSVLVTAGPEGLRLDTRQAKAA